MINKIDKLNFSKTTFEVSIDDNENIIDTLSITKTKTDEKGKLLYEIKEHLPKVEGNMILQRYYRSNEELFYQEASANEEIMSTFEFFVNKNNVIDNAQMITIASESPNDTIFMKYDYRHDGDGKKENLSITSVTDSISLFDYTKYNKNEKPELGYTILDNDTVQKRKMSYLNGKMIESTYEFKEPFRIKISTYDNNENIKSEILFVKVNDTIKKATEYIYDNNKYENTELIIIKDLLNDTIVKKKKITAHNKA